MPTLIRRIRRHFPQGFIASNRYIFWPHHPRLPVRTNFQPNRRHAALLIGTAATLLTALCPSLLAADAETEQRLKALEQQNQSLQQKLDQQQRLIDELSKKLSTGRDVEPAPAASDDSSKRGNNFGLVRISGEGGVGVFHTSSSGRHDHTDFRVDEAKLFIEAPLWKNYAFAFAELDLLTRERQVSGPADDAFHLGELYVDFESVSRLWGKPGMLGIRVGRIDIPFGEEYAVRDVIDNPLISHSLTDFWGIDEGMAFYGGIGRFDYVVAVQNGGHPMLADFNGDKSVSGRVGWAAAKGLRISASAMRTGDLDADEDRMSELWFGNGFLRAIGPGATTYGAEIFEGDVQYAWNSGHLKGAGGVMTYHDNAPGSANSDRDVYFYYLEALQRVPQLSRLYGAARLSQIFADGGIPVVGHGDFGPLFFNPAMMTDRMWRLSVGGGYEFSENLKLKLEYNVDRQHFISVADAENIHFLAAEIGFAF